ncbi:beta-lactamase family protein [Pseudomaricurvus alkylphenolicus]|uniref:serine hydrolase domain-containing protein n=1 Tax=Pseudomaricurvus alkylphenolicus TaxID=1306991 RepID=UPI001421813E|nr:serine hydrolase domain-containing protein [Pseudomaricurvus alkylphenolicus]NIB38152.1 beta-lactamase family protein [Pseudomaricurvus alkylphenolicus]
MENFSKLPLPCTSAKDVGFSQQRLDGLSAMMDSAVAEGSIPGATTIVAREGKIVYARATGYSDMEKKTPLSEDSLFRMYSQTKPVIAALTMRLYEKGSLLLDSAISEFLPEFSDLKVRLPDNSAADLVRGAIAGVPQEVAFREITVRDLLTMTSGLSTSPQDVSADQIYPLGKIWSATGFYPPEMFPREPHASFHDSVLAIAALPLASHPGRKWRYGSDYDVLTLLLERITGSSIDELLKQELLAPLGMESTSFYCSESNVDDLTSEHAWGPEGDLIVATPPQSAEKASFPEQKRMSGNGIYGGLLSTAGDYLKFAQMLLDNGIWEDQQILGRKTVELMSADHIPNDEVNLYRTPGYGFGFGVSVRRTLAGAHTPGSIGEFGWGGAGGTSFMVDPKEKLVTLFFTHVFGYQFHPLADLYEQFQSRVYQAML